MKLSGIVITKNEEEMIEGCLKTLDFCDEIVVIDAGSTDKTVAIAKKYHANVYENKSQDFSEHRNVGKEKAKGDWLLYVDADERVSESLRESIKYQVLSIKQQNIVAYRTKRKNFYLGNHEWPMIEHLERLFRKENLGEWYGKLHESPKVNGEIGELDGYLLHYTHRSLSAMVEKTIVWSKIEAQNRLDAGHPPMTWWRFPRVMWSGFYNSYIVQKGWKVGTVGLIESMYQGFSMFVTYARLWELQQQSKNQNAKIKNTNQN